MLKLNVISCGMKKLKLKKIVRFYINYLIIVYNNG